MYIDSSCKGANYQPNCCPLQVTLFGQHYLCTESSQTQTVCREKQGLLFVFILYFLKASWRESSGQNKHHIDVKCKVLINK